MHEIISPVLILIGAVFLVISINDARKIVSKLFVSKLGWNIVLQLMLFFLVGYFLSMIIIVAEKDTLLTFLASLMYLGCGVLSFIVTRINKDAAEKLSKFDTLENENIYINVVRQRLKSVLDSAAESIITFSDKGLIDSCNKAGENLFGYSEKELLGQKIWLLIPEFRQGYLKDMVKLDGRELELEGMSKDSRVFPISFKAKVMQVNGQQLYTSIILDVSEKKRMVAKLQMLADHDDLTHLYNRRYFQHRLHDALELMKRGVYACSLVYIDLDNFKDINDTFGHLEGDNVLLDAAKALQKGARKSDCVARYGGDEFVILLYDTTKATSLSVAEKIRKTLSAHPFYADRQPVRISCSVGVLQLDDKQMTAQEALSRADFACYCSKKDGRNQVQMYDKMRVADAKDKSK